MKHLVFSLITFTLFSCTDLEKGKYIDSIKTMNGTLDSIQTVLAANKIDSISSMTNAAYVVESRIKTNYVSDTINMSLGKKMDAYKVMGRTLGSLGRSYTIINRGVITERETLINLKSDIENGNGEREKYGEFVQFEKVKVNQLVTLLSQYLSEKKKSLKTFRELHTELELFSLSLLKKKKVQ